jgi:hypothetical protein
MTGFLRRIKYLYLFLPFTLIFSLYGCANSSTPDQITNIQQTCLLPQALLKSLETGLGGVVAVSTFSSKNPDYFFDLETKTSYPFPYPPSEYRLWGGRISPNGHWIAFEVDHIDSNGDAIDGRLEIFDAHGQQIEKMAWKKQWGVLREWLDNKNLFIDGWGPNLGKIFVVNPFTKESEELHPTFSNLFNEYPSPYWSVLPNSELTLALYPNKPSKDENVGFNLWDLDKQKKLWHQDSRTAPSVIPLWSSDQTRFVVFMEKSTTDNQAEIIIVDSSGKLVLQTDFSSNYSYVFIGNGSAWSPDGRYLFFWLSTGSIDNPPNTTSLAMFDLKEKIITDFCINSYGTGNDLTLVQGGKWLITYSDEASSNILIEIAKNKAYLLPIPVDGIIRGWMTKTGQ